MLTQCALKHSFIKIYIQSVVYNIALELVNNLHLWCYKENN